MLGRTKFSASTALLLVFFVNLFCSLPAAAEPAAAAPVAAPASGSPGPETIKPRLLFSVKDKVGDDKGTGKYVYPVSPVFTPRKGHFDLTQFNVYADLSYYYFRMDMGLMDNPWGAPEGFSHQRLAIYIDSVPNQGRTETLQEGAFVDFAPRNAWDYLIDIKGWNHSRLFYYSDLKDAPGVKEGLAVRLIPKTKTIEARVARKLLDDHPETWAFYVLVGSQDGVGPDGFRQVLAKATEWQFGGGTDTYFDSNVIDML
ncbi:MAG TPA: glucodextranase DOMON-like domain-containing protein, partial [Bacillota bacterium]|nr:glucodextranase DOMON-like domain-containing protein [Bacillota bacterium]